MINVTKTFLPPQNEYQAILKKAWEAVWMTNRGVLVQELEAKLKAYLKVPNIIATTNGTLPLQIAIKALGLKGDIITTPFSYVASTSSIVWEGCSPVYVDINSEFLTIDATKIEAAITPKTTGILATHVFGNPCDIDAIEVIAKKHGLKVIYDAAHCFGVTYKGKSIFTYGDISTCSFHSTKLFHTGEGGALFTQNDSLYNTLFYMHNFGHDGPEAFQGIGVNAKMSELQAAMGLSVLPYMEFIISQRKAIVQYYDSRLKKMDVQILKIRNLSQWNYSYFPVIFKDEEQLLKVKKQLAEKQIFPRRYFYPSLNTIEYTQGEKMPVSESIATRILCLPLFHDLEIKNAELICDIILKI